MMSFQVKGRARVIEFLLIAALAAVEPLPAFATETHQFDVPAEDAPIAIRDFASQAHVQILVAGDNLQDKHFHAVSGDLSIDQGLHVLLADSGLVPQYVGDRSIALVTKPNLVSSDQQTSDRKPRQRLLLAQGGQAPAEPPAPAQSAAPGNVKSSNDSGNLQEIIVSAQKRQERVQDVPISVAVLSGASLDRSTLQGITAELNNVPGVAAAQAQFGGSTQITIRGVSAAAPTFDGASPIGYYIDSMPFGLVSSAIAPDANAYDMERIEVLRGPQGTLYGASAQNGVVRLITHDADLNTFDFKARLVGSSTQYGGPNGGFDAAVNIPLIEDKLAARLVAGYDYDSGWIDRLDRQNANEDHLLNLRLKVNARPTEDLTVGLTVWHSESNYAAVARGISDTYDPEHNNDPLKTGFDTYGLKIGYDFSGFSIASTTSYLNYREHFYQQLAPFGDLLTEFPASTLSQEIYLNSTSQGVWRWTAGLAYRDGKDRLNQVILPIAPPDPVSHESKSIAVFGQLTRLFFDDKIEATAGLRYFSDDYTQVELGPNFTNHSTPTNAHDTFTKTSPKFALSWHASDDLTTYMSYSEGFRSGFSQTPAVQHLAPAIPPAQPDNLQNYEVGAKGSIASRIRFDTAAYYIHWMDVQSPIAILVPGTTNVYQAGVLNSKAASGPGVEGAVQLLVFTGLQVALNASWNDLVQDSNVYSQSAAYPNGFLVFPKGSRLAYSPQTTAGFSIDYEVPLPADGYNLHFSGSGNYVSGQYVVSFRQTFNQYLYAPSAFNSRISTSIESKDGWTATLFVNNLGNSVGQPFQLNSNTVGGTFERPRTAGVQLDYHFK
jgi:iron complex outermembrane receptor protein